MKNFFKEKMLKINPREFQDMLFLGVIFVFFAVLIIGLFPGEKSEIFYDKDFFLYIMMLVPAIAAIYFIIIAFRRNLYLESFELGSSIRSKLAIAFLFVAVIPVLIIILASSNFMNKTFSKLLSEKTEKALSEAVIMSKEPVHDSYNNIIKELESLKYIFDNNILSPAIKAHRNNIRKISNIRNFKVGFYNYNQKRDKKLNILDDKKNYNSGQLMKFLNSINYSNKFRIDRINLSGKNYLIGSIKKGLYLIVLQKNLPDVIEKRKKLFNSSLKDYLRLENFQKQFENRSGVFLLIISIIIIFLSFLVSLYLSRNITKPIMEMADSAKEFAHGNFNIRLKRKQKDELGQLFDSFNEMVIELDNNRKLMYQKQKLEAWREMAKRLVHEIKNPLTPIRLSADRMRKRFIENHPDIEKIIMTGTETIAEEVEVLKNILNEFTQFARLPEMKLEMMNINTVLKNCVDFFSAHENITFKIQLDENIPDINIDKIFIRQMINNLLQNSIEACNEKGNINLISELMNDDYEKFVKIRIIDDGIGIKEDDLDKIFEPGFSRKRSGSGLGLAIVEKIVIEHGGRIYCKPEPDVGSEFIIELPIKNYSIEERVNGQDSDS